jgi:hypothetical protein
VDKTYSVREEPLLEPEEHGQRKNVRGVVCVLWHACTLAITAELLVALRAVVPSSCVWQPATPTSICARRGVQLPAVLC